MKLLVFINSLSSGGAERVTANLCNHWAQKAWNITVVTFEDKEKDFYELHPEVDRIALGLDDQSSNVFEAIKNNFFRLKMIRKIIKRQSPDVAIGMMTTINCLLGLASFGLNTKTIGSERTYPPMQNLNSTWKYLRQHCYGELDVLTVQTEEVANWIKKNTNTKKIEIISNPVVYPIESTEPILNPENIIGNKRSDKLLLSVGSLRRVKGFDRLISVFSMLKEIFPDWGLVILGEGEERVMLEQKIHKMGLEDNVYLPGRVGNIGEWYQSADLYSLVSRVEGFPNSLIEAMAYGVPTVAVDCKTGPSEILRSGIDGILVPQDDKVTLFESLQKLMKDKELRRRYGQEAIAVRERLSINKVSQQWQNIF